MVPGNSTSATITAAMPPSAAIVESIQPVPVKFRYWSPQAAALTRAMNTAMATTAPLTITRRNGGSEAWAKALMSAASMSLPHRVGKRADAVDDDLDFRARLHRRRAERGAARD